MSNRTAATSPARAGKPRPRAFATDIWRTIRGSLKRFLSIAVICTLGISIMIGLRAGCEDLRRSVNAHFAQQGVFDVSVQGTLGLTKADVHAVQKIKGVDAAEGLYAETVQTTVDGSRKRASVQSLSTKNMDEPVLVDGTLPQAKDQIAVSSTYLADSGKKLGDTVSFDDAATDGTADTDATTDNDATDADAGTSTAVFARRTYTITAEISDPTDISAHTGSSFRSNTTTDYTFYVDKSAATASAFTAIHVRVASSASLYCFDSAYTKQVAAVKRRLERISSKRERARRKQLVAQATAAVDDAQAQATQQLDAQAQQLAALPQGSAARTAAEAQLTEQRTQLTQQFDDARTQAADAIGESTWYIQDRNSISSFSSVDSDMSSIESIATAFPAIFFVVAILISLTTATRMVEEERTLIGLYKALGYSRGRVLFKYVCYSMAACIVGGALGNLLGFVALPLFLFQVFTSMYVVPNMQLFYNPMASLGSVALFALGIVGATVIACRHELAETPAALMRPKAPRAGSRILLERIRPLWRRFSFLNKVAARNLFRYKTRLAMTVFGIAGCTALVICGLGIRDTVVALSSRQYGGVTRYDLMAVATSDTLADRIDDLKARAADDKHVSLTSYIPVQLESDTVTFNGKSESIQLVVVPTRHAKKLKRYVRLANADGSAINLAKAHLDLSKSAQMVLGAQVGDKLQLQDASLDTATLTVGSTSQNYLGSTVYITQKEYERALGKKMQVNAVLANLTGTQQQQIDFCSELSSDGWISVASTQDMVKNFEKNFVIINAVVVLVTVMAACLSFVVVFTLSNTNISERERELATIKVLGFRRREVHHYVNKETLILTALGAVLGMPLGYVLARSFTYVLQMPSLYFDVQVNPPSYAVAVSLAFAFTLVVNQATNRTLNKIDMVGALKSAE